MFYCELHLQMYPGALEDFDKNTPSTTRQSGSICQNEVQPAVCSSTEKTECNGEERSGSTAGKDPSPSQGDSDAQMEAHFAKAAEDLENAVKTMLGNEPELLAQLGQFAQATAKADHGEFWYNFMSNTINYRPFLHYTPVRKHKEMRMRLGWTISYKSLYFVHWSLELVPLFTGMWERSITYKPPML